MQRNSVSFPILELDLRITQNALITPHGAGQKQCARKVWDVQHSSTHPGVVCKHSPKDPSQYASEYIEARARAIVLRAEYCFETRPVNMWNFLEQYVDTVLEHFLALCASYTDNPFPTTSDTNSTSGRGLSAALIKHTSVSDS